MEDQLLQLGVGGLFAILILREVFSFLKSQRDKKEAGEDPKDKTRRQVNEIWGYHFENDGGTGLTKWRPSRCETEIKTLRLEIKQLLADKK